MISNAPARGRRRPVTYGKAARRYLPDAVEVKLGRSEEDILDATCGSERTISGRIKKSNTQVLRKTRTLENKSPKRSQSHGDNGSISTEATTLSSVASSPITSAPSPTILDAGNNESILDSEKIYDVPLSDNESGFCLKPQGRTPNKRRRLKYKPTQSLGHGAWDDASLQQDIAIQTCSSLPSSRHGSNLQKPINGSKGISLQGVHAETAGDHLDTITDRECQRQKRKAERPTTSKNTVVINKEDVQEQHSQREMVVGMKRRAVVGSPRRPRNDQRASIAHHTKDAKIPPTCDSRGESRHINMNDRLSYITSPKAVESVSPPCSPSRGAHYALSSRMSPRRGVKELQMRNRAESISPDQLSIASVQTTGLAKRPPQPGSRPVCASQSTSTALESFRPSRAKLKNRLQVQKSNSRFHGDRDEDGNSLSSDSQSDVSVEQENPETNSSADRPQKGHTQASTVLHGGNPKVTYAKQRSYLTEDSVGDAVLLSQPIPIHPKSAISSARVGGRTDIEDVQVSQRLVNNMEETDDQKGGAIRSIHELREAGGNARLMSETEAILDDIGHRDASPISLQRRAMLQLVTKLQHRSFCIRFAESDLGSRLLEGIVPVLDPVVGILLMSALLHIMASRRSPHTLSRISEFHVIDFLEQQLDNTDDVLLVIRSRESNLSKALRMEIEYYFGKLRTSSIWRLEQPPQITARTLSLQCLEHIVKYARDAALKTDILTWHSVERLVDVLVPSNDYSKMRLYPNFAMDMQLSISTLESHTMAHMVANAEGETLWTGLAVEKIVDLFPMTEKWSGTWVERFLTFALRLFVNLTNGSQRMCAAFAQFEIIKAGVSVVTHNFHQLSLEHTDEVRDVLLDNLVLSLGLLTNLAEGSEMARDLFLGSTSGLAQPLDTLLRLFQAKSQQASEVGRLSCPSLTLLTFQAVSEQEITSNVAFGYLSVLLSYLSISPTIRSFLCSQLPGGTLESLFAAVEEFLHFNKQIADEFHATEEDSEMKAGFIVKLQELLNRLKDDRLR